MFNLKVESQLEILEHSNLRIEISIYSDHDHMWFTWCEVHIVNYAHSAMHSEAQESLRNVKFFFRKLQSAPKELLGWFQ